MKKLFNKFQFNAIVAVTILGLTTTIVAQDDLPSADAIMKKYVEATGGVDKIKSIKSVKMLGKFEVIGMGVNGDIESLLVVPNKAYTNVDLGSNGTQTVVCDGETAWDISTMMGPRVLEGTEKSRVMDQANLLRMYDPMKFYKSVKVIGMEEVDGEKTYKVKTETKDGFKTTEFYSAESGLPVAGEAVFPSAMGEIPMKSKFLEYKEVEGVKFPTKVEIRMAAGGFVQSFDKIEVNKDFDKKNFEMPEEIKVIVENTKR